LAQELRVAGDAHFGDVQAADLDVRAHAVRAEHLADHVEDHAAHDDVPPDADARFDELRDELLRIAVEEARHAEAGLAEVLGRADAVPALAVATVREQADGDETPGAVHAVDADGADRVV